MMRERQLFSIQEMTVGGLFAALITAGAFIKITLPTEPMPMHFTLQWFFVLIAGFVLDKRLAGASVGVYLLIGLVGVPVFASGGGPSYLLRPTFGYLLGFAVAAYMVAWLCEICRVLDFGKMLLISVIGLLVYYSIGVSYYFVICHFLIFQELTWQILLFNCFLSTIAADFVLCIIAVGVSVKLRGAARRILEL